MVAAIKNETEIKRLTIPAGKKSLKRVVFNAGLTGLTIKLTLNPSGNITRSWIAVDSRLKGGEKGLGGTFPKISLDNARKLHRELMDRLAGGEDVNQPAVVIPPTLNDLFDLWIASDHAPKSKLNYGYRTIWNKWARTSLGQIKTTALNRTAIHQHLKTMTNNGAENMNAARRVRDIATALVTRLDVDYGVEVQSPVTLQKIFGSTKAVERMTQPRENYLTVEQLRLLWAELMSDRTRPAYLAMRWLVCTATRKTETVDAAFKELNGDHWLVPGERTKTKKPLEVPICPLMKDVLDDVAALEHKGFIFSVGSTTLNHCCDRWRAVTGNECFTPHDLRRTAVVLTTNAGLLDPFHADLMLNHTPSKTAILRNYQPEAFGAYVTAAIAVWQKYLGEVVA